MPRLPRCGGCRSIGTAMIGAASGTEIAQWKYPSSASFPGTGAPVIEGRNQTLGRVQVSPDKRGATIMIFNRLTAVVGALGLGALLTVVTAGRTHADLLLQDNPPAAQAGDQPPQNQDMDVLARGPIHEAYAEPVNPSPRATP